MDSENELYELCKKSDDLNLHHSKFFEEDLNNALTAICLEPGKLTKKLVSNLKLAFRDKSTNTSVYVAGDTNAVQENLHK